MTSWALVDPKNSLPAFVGQFNGWQMSLSWLNESRIFCEKSGPLFSCSFLQAQVISNYLRKVGLSLRKSEGSRQKWQGRTRDLQLT